MRMIKENKGSFTNFMAITISSVMVLTGVLLNGAKLNSDRHRIKSALVIQNDLLLSEYSEILLDRYGIYATAMRNTYDEIFYEISGKSNGEIIYYVSGKEELKGSVLENAIMEFACPRFPLIFAIDTIKRFTDYLDKTGEALFAYNQKSNWGFDLDQGEYDLFRDYYFIKEILRSFIGEDEFIPEHKTDITPDMSFEDLNNLLLVDDENLAIESYILKDIKSNFTNPEKLFNEISSSIEIFYDIEMPGWYERMAFEHYIYKMFPCKVNFRVSDGIKIYHVDLRNRELNSYAVELDSELERIIFGTANNQLNEIFVQSVIYTIRTMLHVGGIMTDSTKMSGIMTASTALCSIIAAASGGTIAIPPEAMEAVLIVLWAISAAASDYITLTNGKSVRLIPSDVRFNIDTYYKDYLLFMQILVPKNIKLSRIEAIIKENTNNTNNTLYTSVATVCTFRNIEYKIEGSYYE